MNKKLGRGSVSRSIRYHKRMEDKEFRNKKAEYSKMRRNILKKKINNRCLTCKKLISPQAKRCMACSIKKHRLDYLRSLE